jgi:hypothetical protein
MVRNPSNAARPSPARYASATATSPTANTLHGFRAQSRNQADFSVQVCWKAFSPSGADGSAFDLIERLQVMPLDWQPHEVAVRAKMNKTEHLPLRLIILRKSPEATEKTCKRLRRNAIRQQKKLDPRSRVTAEFLILAASLPAEPYPGEEVLAAYRLRWQIALAFKPNLDT